MQNLCKLSIALIFVAAAAAVAVAASGAPRGAAPKKLETVVREHDCGVVSEAKIARYEFVYENDTAAPLGVANIAVSCGCLRVLEAPDEIAPRGAGKFLLEFNLKGYAGAVTQTALVTFRDEKAAPVLVRLKATAPGLYARSGSVDLGRVALGETAAQDLEILAIGMPKATITEASGSEHLNVSLKEVESDASKFMTSVGTLAKIRVELRHDNADDVGKYQGSVFITTNVPGQETLTLPVRADKLGRFETKPTTVFFGTVVPGKKVTRTVSLAPAIATASAEMLHGTQLAAEHREVTAVLKEPVKSGAPVEMVIQCALNSDSKSGILQGRIIGKSPQGTLFAVPYSAFLKGP